MRGPRRESRVRVWWGMERLGERPSRSLSSPATFFFLSRRARAEVGERRGRSCAARDGGGPSAYRGRDALERVHCA
jgi:hypothetical protein